jgi:HlyD family type I secretion membrane fusion protein
MKINGSSRIISDNAKQENVAFVEKVSEKEKQENLVSVAEASDLLHNEIIENDKSKFGQIKKIKKMAYNALEKGKPLLEKQKLLAGEMVKKARGVSPYADKTITAIDVAINYITKSEKIEGRSEVVQETRAPAVFGVWVLIITFGVGMLWSMIAPLDSASHAIGKIVLESKKRIIQHPDGGIVKEVFVKDGDHVKKGQVLMTLDDTDAKAQKNQTQHKYYGLLAEINRLTSERDGKEEIEFSQELLSQDSDPEVKEIISNQEKYFKAAKDAVNSQISLTEKRIEQSIEQKNALIPQIEATEKLIKISTDQVNSYRKLFAKGNLNKAYLQQAESSKAEQEGRKGQLTSALAQAEQVILQSKIELENYKHKVFQDITNQLKQVQVELAMTGEALKQAKERLSRTVITAPEDGDISNLNDSLTPRSVFYPQHVLMEVVPQDDNLIVEAKIPAEDIAAVKVGQISRVRLTAYRARVVPVLDGKLISLSADVVIPDQKDMQTGTQRPYYKGRIVIDKDNLAKVAKLKDVKLYPGMGVDVIIVTGTRTLAKYIMDPITLTLDHAFIEK